jgi:hypothetical protein
MVDYFEVICVDAVMEQLRYPGICVEGLKKTTTKNAGYDSQCSGRSFETGISRLLVRGYRTLRSLKRKFGCPTFLEGM